MKTCLLLVLGFAALASVQTYWQVVNSYSDSACSTRVGGIIADGGGLCASGANVSCTSAGSLYYTMDCLNRASVNPFATPIPTGWAIFNQWFSTPDCPSTPYLSSFGAPNACVVYGYTSFNGYFKITTDCSSKFTFGYYTSSNCTDNSEVYSYSPGTLNSCLVLVTTQSEYDYFIASCQAAPPVNPVAPPVSPPVIAPVAQPVVASIATPVVQPVAIPIANPVAVPVVEQVTTPTDAPIAEPVATPLANPIAEVVTPTADPIVVPVAEPVATPLVGSVTEPAASPKANSGAAPVVEDQRVSKAASHASSVIIAGISAVLIF